MRRDRVSGTPGFVVVRPLLKGMCPPPFSNPDPTRSAMSEEKPPSEAPPPKAKANPIVLIGVIAGALIAGAATGGLLVGPRLAGGKPAPAAHGEAAEDKEESGGGHGGGHGGKEKGRIPTFKVENIIVNPSGSQGAHFLMATIAVEVPTDKMEEKLREHDAEIRDMVITILERQSLEELSQPGARERLKRSILTGLLPLTGKAEVRVFLPQFVIQ